MSGKRGQLTVFSGPPRSGKTTESRRMMADPDVDVFVPVEGHGEQNTLDEVEEFLSKGMDVVYETTLPINKFPGRLQMMADSIELFKVYDENHNRI